ncbi:hypothetical protein I6F18_18795 [Bradyrhizobium sp. NBAIM32]|uniref:hypothetical protein n=1 Tax=Bradyrhizobium sp. NBAIM32 TaxID=2793809 RepID=UPI001CD2F585|nr:hypothetical protein [Bradyrhizobium sp. NBAIM32]MCA1542011.1 hypothetical protein [Bradyrhizobium sp. NBAIM32]
MPTGIEDMLPPLAPSASLDGLDLTPAEMRALSPEMFARVFALPSIDHVPAVGSGFLKRRPPGATFWLRFRAAPDKDEESAPGEPAKRSKNRQIDAWQLVFKAPVYAPAEAGGGVAIKTGTVTLKAKDLEGAKAEALIMIARAQGKTIRATTWPIERIERLNCSAMLKAYLEVDLAKPRSKRRKGDKPARRGRKTPDTAEVLKDDVKPTRDERKLWRTYRAAIEAFRFAFPTLEIGDCKGRIDLRIGQAFEERAGLEPTSRYAYLRTVQMALNEILGRMGVPVTYRVNFENRDPGPLPKPNWTPDEYDRLRAAAEGWRYHPGGAPMMIPGPQGLVQARRPRPENRDAWSFMIPMLAYSVSRNGQIHLTRWVPGTVEPRGRKFARGEERPWLEVLPDCIVFHRDGNERYDGTKRHGWNFIPKEFEPEVRARHARDMAAGIEWVFHKPDGERYGERLPSWTFRQIVADAGLPEGTTPHSLKDLAVAWADAAGIPRPTFSEHADTSEKTIDRTYGPSRKVDVLEAAAEQFSQKPWREKEERRAAQAGDFLARRDEAYAEAAAAKSEARRAARRAADARRRAAAGGTSSGAPAPAAVVPIRPAGPAVGDAVALPQRRRAAAARASS